MGRRRFLGASAAVLLVTACGGAPGPSPQAGTQPPAAKPAGAAPTSPAPAAAATPAAARPASSAGGGSLKVLARSHFVPAFDAWWDKWAADWGAANKVEVTIDHILAGELPAKWAAEVAASAGHDLFGFTQGGAVNIYNKQLVDLGEVAEALGKKHGGWVDPLASHLGKFQGVWRGVPDYFVEFSCEYRKDLFEQNGLKVVDTWDDLLKAGTVLKQKGSPIGIAINQKSNDSNNTWHSMLWSYGVSYAREDGKMASFNSQETKDAVKLAVELYQKTMTDEVLSWDDTGNNQGLLSGRISWIQNPISSLRTIEKEKPELAKNIGISNAPAGPRGRYASVSVAVFGLMSFSPSVNQAKAFLTDYYATYAEGVKASEGYNQPLLKDFRKKPMPIIGTDPRLEILQDFDQVARAVGHPGPPTPAAAEVESNWLIPLMIGRAVQSNVDEAVAQAAQRIEQIYKKHNLT
ncbi:MAG TPA: extracellular solute-binding protein [Chloroflexota bacterium]